MYLCFFCFSFFGSLWLGAVVIVRSSRPFDEAEKTSYMITMKSPNDLKNSQDKSDTDYIHEHIFRCQSQKLTVHSLSQPCLGRFGSQLSKNGHIRGWKKHLPENRSRAVLVSWREGVKFAAFVFLCGRGFAPPFLPGTLSFGMQGVKNA